jgi:hypothetical protein
MSYGSPGLSSVGTTHRPLGAPGVAGAGKRQGSWAESQLSATTTWSLVELAGGRRRTRGSRARRWAASWLSVGGAGAGAGDGDGSRRVVL